MKRFIFTGLAAAGAALISQFPLSLVSAFAGDALPSTTSVTGTVWKGQISGLPGAPDVSVKLKPLAGGVHVSGQNSQQSLDVLVKMGGHMSGDLKSSLNGFSLVDPRLQGLDGTIAINVTNLKLSEQCIGEGGQVSTDVLQANRAKWGWEGPVLSGPLRCEDGNFVVTLTGSDKGQTVNVDLQLLTDGSYRTEVGLKTADRRAGDFLPLFGFENKAGTFRLNEAGRWR